MFSRIKSCSPLLPESIVARVIYLRNVLQKCGEFFFNYVGFCVGKLLKYYNCIYGVDSN